LLTQTSLHVTHETLLAKDISGQVARDHPTGVNAC
jgi:hypothetical protein